MNHDEAFTRGYNKSNEELQEMELVLVGRYVSFSLITDSDSFYYYVDFLIDINYMV